MTNFDSNTNYIGEDLNFLRNSVDTKHLNTATNVDQILHCLTKGFRCVIHSRIDSSGHISNNYTPGPFTSDYRRNLRPLRFTNISNNDIPCFRPEPISETTNWTINVEMKNNIVRLMINQPGYSYHVIGITIIPN